MLAPRAPPFCVGEIYECRARTANESSALLPPPMASSKHLSGSGGGMVLRQHGLADQKAHRGPAETAAGYISPTRYTRRGTSNSYLEEIRAWMSKIDAYLKD